MLRIPDNNTKKYKTRWVKVFWAGNSELDYDHFVITEDGCVAGRTVHRLPERPTYIETIVGCKCLPWDPKGLTATLKAPEEDDNGESSAALALPPVPRVRKRATPKAAQEKDEAEDSSTSTSSSSSSSSERESERKTPETKTPERPKAPERPPGIQPTQEPEVFDPQASSSTAAARPIDVEFLECPHETPSISAPATWLTVQSGDWIQGSKDDETRKRAAIQEPTELIADAKRYRVNVDTLEVNVDHVMAEVRDLEGWQLLQEDGGNYCDLWEEPLLIPKYSKAWDPVELFQARKTEVVFLEKFPALEYWSREKAEKANGLWISSR